MNFIIKLIMGLGCVGMYVAWRHVPDTPVMGLAMSSVAMYASLAVVAAGFVAGMVFGNEDDLKAEIDAERVLTAKRSGETSEYIGLPLVVNPAQSAVDVFYDDNGWLR